MDRARGKRTEAPYVVPNGGAPHRLRVERFQRQLTQVRLGRAARVDPATISKIEAGKLTPTAAVKGRLAGVLGLDPAVLFGSEPPA